MCCEHSKMKQIGTVRLISDSGKDVGCRLFWYCKECREQWETEESRLEAKCPTIICLCGSTRFMDEFVELNRILTMKGKIVLTVGVFGHSESGGQEALTQGTKDSLDELHLRKIDLADEVLIVNVGGYIGDSTLKEIAYAKKIGKIVKYLEFPAPTGAHQEI